MNRKTRFLIPLFCTIFLLLFIQMAQPAAAEKGVQWESSWQVDANFIGNQPNATLTVKVWAVGAGFYAEEKANLRCYPAIGVAFADNQAVFSGQGGIRCLMPDMAAMVYAMTDVPEAPAPPFVLPESCDCKKGAFANAVVDLTANSTPKDWGNPIFSLEDMSLAMPIEAGMSAYSSMVFTVDGAASASSLFNGANTTTFAQFSQQGGKADVYNVQFKANGLPLFATPENIKEALTISTDQPVLHIGYSPITGEAMNGRLKSLTVDPGCFGVD